MQFWRPKQIPCSDSIPLRTHNATSGNDGIVSFRADRLGRWLFADLAVLVKMDHPLHPSPDRHKNLTPWECIEKFPMSPDVKRLGIAVLHCCALLVVTEPSLLGFKKGHAEFYPDLSTGNGQAEVLYAFISDHGSDESKTRRERKKRALSALFESKQTGARRLG